MSLTILFDFDGVMADTNQIRLQGFVDLYSYRFPGEIERYASYLRQSHGISRYEKIKHFYYDILKEDVSDKRISKDALTYSDLVKQKVIDAPEIPGSISFLDKHQDKVSLGLISASDEEELIDVCRARGIHKYFDGIMGSPAKKSDNIHAFVMKRQLPKDSVWYVGDANQDEMASRKAGVSFIGFGERREFSPGAMSVKNYAELDEIISYML